MLFRAHIELNTAVRPQPLRCHARLGFEMPWIVELRLEEGQNAFERMIGDRGETLKMVLRAR